MNLIGSQSQSVTRACEIPASGTGPGDDSGWVNSHRQPVVHTRRGRGATAVPGVWVFAGVGDGDEAAAFAVGAHPAAQREWPFFIIGAGLPNLPAVPAAARSHAEEQSL